MFRNSTLSLFFLFCVTGLWAQLGINGTYFMPKAKVLTAEGVPQGEGVEFAPNGPAIGVNYWLRLKNKRVEFLPELNYTFSNQNLETLNFDAKTQFFSFYFNTRIYFLDFAGDCDCPTFSKEGPTLEKGLFLQLSPGVSYVTQNYEWGVKTREADFAAFSIGAGLGFDIGINDYVTVTPFGGLRYFPNYNWNLDNFFNLANPEEPVTSEPEALISWYAGLHIGLRFDN